MHNPLTTNEFFTVCYLMTVMVDFGKERWELLNRESSWDSCHPGIDGRCDVTLPVHLPFSKLPPHARSQRPRAENSRPPSAIARGGLSLMDRCLLCNRANSSCGCVWELMSFMRSHGFLVLPLMLLQAFVIVLMGLLSLPGWCPPLCRDVPTDRKPRRRPTPRLGAEPCF